MFQGTGLFKKMGSIGDYDKVLDLSLNHVVERLPIKLKHTIVFAADKKEGGGTDTDQGITGEIGTAAARDDGLNKFWLIGGDFEGGGGTGRGAEVTKIKLFKTAILLAEDGSGRKPGSKKFNVKTDFFGNFVNLFFPT